MGLDIVEFIMTVEETFGVPIPDREAERIRTAGHLYEFLRQQRDSEYDSDRSCISSSTFYRLRRELCEQTGLARREIAPCTRLEALLPMQGRRELWHSLQRSVSPIQLPQLSPPLWWFVSLLVFIGPGLIAAWCWNVQLSIQRQMPIAVWFTLIELLVVWLIVWITKQVSVGLPWGTVTMRGLVRATLGENRADLERRRDRIQDATRTSHRRLSDRELWEKLRELIASRFGVDPARITHEFDFVYGRVAD